MIKHDLYLQATASAAELQDCSRFLILDVSMPRCCQEAARCCQEAARCYQEAARCRQMLPDVARCRRKVARGARTLIFIDFGRIPGSAGPECLAPCGSLWRPVAGCGDDIQPL